MYLYILKKILSPKLGIKFSVEIILQGLEKIARIKNSEIVSLISPSYQLFSSSVLPKSLLPFLFLVPSLLQKPWNTRADGGNTDEDLHAREDHLLIFTYQRLAASP